jgi:hypothetical protein
MILELFGAANGPGLELTRMRHIDNEHLFQRRKEIKKCKTGETAKAEGRLF